MEKKVRSFEDKPAVRERVPVMAGAMGPSGSGKTYSALLLATGMQRITGGDIFVLDSESRRALHYADKFKFRHVPFGAPFSPLDYLSAIEHCVKKGAGVIIVDSMSHEHEGPGGVLEMHQEEVERLSKGNPLKYDAVNMLAWAKPKAERRRMINSVLQMNANFIFCFRAKEKMKMPKKNDPDREIKELGWMPIAGEEFLYEMTINFVLPPNCNGTPVLDSNMPGEKMFIKIPEQFRKLFKEPRPLDESIGESLAKWAAGELNGNGHKKTSNDTISKLVAAFKSVDVTQEMIEEKLGHSLEKATDYEINNLREMYRKINDGSIIAAPDFPTCSV